MKTKNIITAIALLLTGVVITGTQSCSKYPDGPLISFHSRAERVANTWRIDNYKVNGNDQTSLLSGYTETYTSDGNYSYTWGNFTGTGIWAFQNKDKEIRLTGISNQNDHTLIIQKLEDKQFWYYYMDGGDMKEFHMVQN